MENIKTYMQQVGRQARAAARSIAQADTNAKNRALENIATAILLNSARLISENAKDVAAAKQHGLDAASVDRLTLTERTIKGMAEGLRQIAQLPDPIGEISDIATTIAAAIEEQGAATQEIARNVQQAAAGTTQVASNITDVSRGAAETGSASSQVLSSAQSLANESSRLKLEMDKFLATVRAA